MTPLVVSAHRSMSDVSPRLWRVNGLRSSRRALDLLLIGTVVFVADHLSAPLLEGQETLRLASCTTCELTVSHLVSLGAVADPETPADRFHGDVVHDARGRYFVKAGWPVNRVLVYDSGGSLESVWGRGGEGPGEYQDIGQLLMLLGDSLGVVDGEGMRLTVLDTEGSVARTQPLPIRPFQVAQLDGGTLVVAGLGHTPSEAEYVMHLMLTDGSVSPFGPAQMVLRTRPSASQRNLATAGQTVWAARPDRYELTEYAKDGIPLRVLKREVDWFPNREIEGPMDPAKEPPAPYLMAVRVDQDGFIWTMVTLADANWTPPPDDVESISWQREYDSIVEVIDPDRGVIVRSQRFPWYGQGFTNDGLVVSRRQDALGVTVLDVWHPVG